VKKNDSWAQLGGYQKKGGEKKRVSVPGEGTKKHRGENHFMHYFRSRDRITKKEQPHISGAKKSRINREVK